MIHETITHTRMDFVMKKNNIALWTILSGIVISLILIFGSFKKDVWDILPRPKKKSVFSSK